VLAAYPWSGHQFLDPRVGETQIRVVMGDADEWCSPMQVQGHCQAIRRRWHRRDAASRRRAA